MYVCVKKQSGAIVFDAELLKLDRLLILLKDLLFHRIYKVLQFLECRCLRWPTSRLQICRDMRCRLNSLPPPDPICHLVSMPAACLLLCWWIIAEGFIWELLFRVLMFRFGPAFDCIFSHGNIFTSCNFYSPWFGFKFPRIAASCNDTAEHSASPANHSATGFFGDAILGCCGRSANSVFVEAAEKHKELFEWTSGGISDRVNRISLIPSFSVEYVFRMKSEKF